MAEAEAPSPSPTPAFVAPSDYLRPRERPHANQSREPMSALDHEQRDGLVSLSSLVFHISSH